jgi:CDP-diacylglycerol---serine O-phosphatidyltransferase
VKGIILKLLRKEFKIFKIDFDGFLFLGNFATLMNFLCGSFITIVLIFNLEVSNNLLARILVFGASWDAIDGKLARQSKFKNPFGKQLDTYADLVTFAIAPTLLILDILVPLDPIVALISGGIYLFAASFRLSRFMIEGSNYNFNGMPSPVAAIFVATFFVVRIDPLFSALSIVLISLVMMSNLRYTAMKNISALFDRAHFYLGIILMLLFTYAPDSIYEYIAFSLMIYIFYFIIFGPMHVRHQETAYERRIALAN